MSEYDQAFDPYILIGHCDLISRFSDFTLESEKHKKSSPKPQGPELSYFVCSNVKCINPANCALGGHTGQAPGTSLSAIGF